jgi:hypothetical protein
VPGFHITDQIQPDAISETFYNNYLYLCSHYDKDRPIKWTNDGQMSFNPGNLGVDHGESSAIKQKKQELVGYYAFIPWADPAFARSPDSPVCPSSSL